MMTTALEKYGKVWTSTEKYDNDDTDEDDDIDVDVDNC